MVHLERTYLKDEGPPTPTDETAFIHPPHFSPTNPLHTSLRNLDASFRCPICHELYKIPVSLYPCLHSYCSVCIRKNLATQYGGMKRKAECPTCSVNLLSGGQHYDKAILPNRELEQRVILYGTSVREELRNSLIKLDVLEKQKNAESHDDEEEEENESKPAASVKRARRSTANYKRDYSSDHEDDEDRAMTSTNDANVAYSTASSSSSSSPTVALPPPQHQQPPSRKRKPTPSYHSLKRKQLIKLCSESNLPTTGTDIELRQRHSEFILQYNSQCDSLHPMSEAEVVQKVVRDEQCRKREARRSGGGGVIMKRLGESLAANNDGNGSTVVTTGSKKVDGEMNSKFKDMIAELKARKRGETSAGDGGAGEPSCIAAAEATKAANMNGNSSGNYASRHRTEVGNAAAAAPSTRTASAAAATTSFESASAATTTSASINVVTTTTASTLIKPTPKEVKLKPTTTTAKTTTRTTTTKKQATITSKKKSPSKTTSGIWKCPTCTFENHKYTTANALCEMCSSPRPEKENTSNEVIAIDC